MSASQAFPIVVLVITDGLDRIEAAEAAARALAAHVAFVNVLLIDPTPQGEELARKVVSEDGEVTAVTSAHELRMGIVGSGNSGV